jgi:hypothetical protein
MLTLCTAILLRFSFAGTYRMNIVLYVMCIVAEMFLTWMACLGLQRWTLFCRFCNLNEICSTALDNVDPPQVTGGQSSYDVNPGNNVTLPCSYDAYPAPDNVTWFKDSQPLTLPSADGRLTRGNFSEPWLTIADAHISDAADYRCDVMNTQGSGSSGNMRLNVVCE